MRITNGMIRNNSLNSLYISMGRMDTVFNQMNTLKKVQRPSDDPIVAGRSLKLRINVMETEQHKNNVSEAKAWMDVTETALSNMTEILKEIRTKSTQAANGTLTPDDRQKIVNDIEQLYKQLQQESNVTYAGRYVFSGFKTDQSVYLDKNTKLENASILANELTLGSDMTLDADATLKNGSILTNDIVTSDDITLEKPMELVAGMTPVNDILDENGAVLHPAGVAIPAGTIIPSGAVIQTGETLPAGQPLPADITLPAGTTIEAGSQIAAGSKFEGKVVLEGDITLSGEMTLPAGMTLTVDIVLPDGTTLAAGTPLAADTKLPAGTKLPEGTFLPVGTTLPKGTLNPEVIGKTKGQEIQYEIGVGTTADVNTLGVPELMAQIDGDIQSILAALKSDPPLSDDELNKLFTDMLGTIDERLSTTSEMTASLGSRQSRLEYTESRLIDDKTNLTALLSKTEDVDLEDTYVEFNTQYMIYQSALQATSKVIMTNLGDFLR